MNNDVLVIGAPDVEAALQGREAQVLDAVRKAYETHTRGATSLPHSSFLRFPDSDKDRIICLPAYLGEDYQLAGVKWIASVPANVEKGMERASAVMILNDRATGRPVAVLEGSIISKQRTAASAALASQALAAGEPDVIGLVGCGPINLAVVQFLVAVWPATQKFMLYDLSSARADSFAGSLKTLKPDATIKVASSLDQLLAECPMVSLGTTAIKPHVAGLDDCPVDSTLLHVSLRDLSAAAILGHHNFVDDLDHVNRASTSIHLASQQEGHTRFVHSTLGELLLGVKPLPERDGRPFIFSPFGLGILDLAVADLVMKIVAEERGGTLVKSFLP